MSKLVFVDIETKFTNEDLGGWYFEDMEISVAVTYDKKRGYRSWTEDNIEELLEYLDEFDFIVGFNLIEFDYKVLSAYDQYSKIDELQNKTIDILSILLEETGVRISLNNLAQLNLNESKVGNGNLAVTLFKSNKIDELIDYCKCDVRLTRGLFEHIITHKYLICSINFTEVKVPVVFPFDIKYSNMKFQDSKNWFDGYFQSLMLGSTITKEQVKLLSKKVDELFEQLSSEEIDDEFEEEDEYSSPSPTKHKSLSSSDSILDDAADDLPF